MTTVNDSPISLVAGEDLAANLRVKCHGGDRKAYLADASDYGIGTVLVGVSDGEMADIRLDSHGGSLKMVASAAITAGQKVYAAASGKIAATGTKVIGTALDTATGNNSVIEVLPHVSRTQSSSSSSSSSSS